MKTSDKGLMALISHEGIVLSPYKDSVGVWTIGIGHTKAAGGINPETFKGKLTLRQVFDLLKTDIAKYEAGVNAAVKVPIKQHEFDALVSFHYNTGAIGRATLTKLVNKGDMAGAAKAFMSWTKPPEIKARRIAEQELFRTGKYPAQPFANVYDATPQGKVLWESGKRIDLQKALYIDAVKPGSDPVNEVPPAPKPEPEKSTATLWAGVAAAIGAAVAGTWATVAALPCNWFGVFCN